MNECVKSEMEKITGNIFLYSQTAYLLKYIFYSQMFLSSIQLQFFFKLKKSDYKCRFVYRVLVIPNLIICGLQK